MPTTPLSTLKHMAKVASTSTKTILVKAPCQYPRKPYVTRTPIFKKNGLYVRYDKALRRVVSYKEALAGLYTFEIDL